MNAHQRRKFTRAAPKHGDPITFKSRDRRRWLTGVVVPGEWPVRLFPNLRKVRCTDAWWMVNIKTMAVRR